MKIQFIMCGEATMLTQGLVTQLSGAYPPCDNIV